MSKVFGFAVAALVAFGFSSAQASVDLSSQVHAIQQSAQIQAAFAAGLNWKVGDKASYKLSSQMLNGTVDSFVKEDTGTGYWLEQDMHLGMFGENKIEALLNKNTGKVEKLLLNGKEQSVPETDQEIVETRGEKVTVPAGSFDCLYAKIKDKKDGKISQAWLNMKLVPMTGMVKAISESQVGAITQELTSLQFAPR